MEPYFEPKDLKSFTPPKFQAENSLIFWCQVEFEVDQNFNRFSIWFRTLAKFICHNLISRLRTKFKIIFSENFVLANVNLNSRKPFQNKGRLVSQGRWNPYHIQFFRWSLLSIGFQLSESKTFMGLMWPSKYFIFWKYFFYRG